MLFLFRSIYCNWRWRLKNLLFLFKFSLPFGVGGDYVATVASLSTPLSLTALVVSYSILNIVQKWNGSTTLLYPYKAIMLRLISYVIRAIWINPFILLNNFLSVREASNLTNVLPPLFNLSVWCSGLYSGFREWLTAC